MKITSYRNVSNMLKIDVYVVSDKSYEVAAASSSFNFDQILDPQSKAQWNNFIDNLLAMIDQYEFELVDHHSSNRPDSLSHYISFYPVNEDGELLSRFMITARISDHDIPNLDQRSKMYYKNLANRNRRDFHSRNQRYRLYTIIVNNKTYSMYSEALDDIDKLFQEFAQSK